MQQLKWNVENENKHIHKLLLLLQDEQDDEHDDDDVVVVVVVVKREMEIKTVSQVAGSSELTRVSREESRETNDSTKEDHLNWTFTSKSLYHSCSKCKHFFHHFQCFQLINRCLIHFFFFEK